MKFDFRNIVTAFLFSLVGITILSLMVSLVTDIETLKTGKLFLIFFVGIFISVIWYASFDKKIDAKEIWNLLIVSVLLVLAYYAMYHFVPEIFSTILPSPTKELFSIFG